MLHRLASEKARAAAQADAEAQAQAQSEMSRILSAERAVAQESLQQAIIRERIATEDERLRAQIFVSSCMTAVSPFSFPFYLAEQFFHRFYVHSVQTRATVSKKILSILTS